MITPQLAKLMQTLGTQVSRDTFDAALLEIKYTGKVTYDYLNGKPRQINLGQPVVLAICEADTAEVTPGRVDTRR
jgi:hypothetical protein